MTDELVKRLRNIAVHSYLGRLVIEEAADRIEQLERELSISRMAQVVMDNGAEALEQDNHRWKMECENFWRDREKALTAERDKYESAWMTAEGKLADVEAERDRLRGGIEYILYGYGLDGPDYRFPYGEEEPDWITDHLIAVMNGESHD